MAQPGNFPTLGNGSDLQYGGITIINGTTRDFLQKVEYDPTRTDPIGIRYYIFFVGYLSTPLSQAALPFTGFGLTGAGPTASSDTVTSETIIRQAMLTPRQNLSLSIGGKVMVSIYGNQDGPQPINTNGIGSSGIYIPGVSAGGNVQFDIDNGPKPLNLRVTQIAGKGIFKIEFEIEAMGTICTGSPLSSILSNRWSVMEAVNRNSFITRTITGRLRVAAPQVDPDAFRNMAFPPLSSGFRRDSIITDRSADGLELLYVVNDVQVAQAAPYPATSWQCVHRISSPNGKDAMMSIGSVYIVMEGPPTVDKNAMLNSALVVIENRLLLNVDSNGQPTQWTYLGMELVDHVDSSIIEVSTTVQFTQNFVTQQTGPESTQAQPQDVWGTFLNDPNQPAGPLQIYAAVGGADFVYNPLSSVGIPNVPDGSAAYAFVCFLQDPCAGIQGIGKSPSTATPGSGSGNTNGNAPGTTVQNYQSTSLPAQQPTGKALDNNTTATSNGIYTDWKIETRYETDFIRAQCPLADGVAQNDQRTCVVVDIASPVARKLVRLEGSRVGQPPTIPLQQPYNDPAGGKAFPIGRAKINQPARQPMISGQWQYTVQAEMWWALTTAPQPGAALPAAFVPWDAALYGGSGAVSGLTASSYFPPATGSSSSGNNPSLA
jgi:hypothetical protein